MKYLNTGPNREVIESIRLDFAMILTSGKGLIQQGLEVGQILEMYQQSGYISRYENILTTPNEISATVFCPSRARVSVQLPP